VVLHEHLEPYFERRYQEDASFKIPQMPGRIRKEDNKGLFARQIQLEKYL
jgi:hypothetical protein